MNGLVVGAGFWSTVHLYGWAEQPGVAITGLVEPDEERAKTVAAQFGIQRVYADLPTALADQSPNFIDLVTPVETHAPLGRIGIDAGIPVITQKPLADSWEAARDLVAYAQSRDALLLVHENWRWQRALRRVREILQAGEIGDPFRCTISFNTGFAVFKNQPFLRELEHFILTDIGSHVLDLARFYFGEADTVYAQTHRIHRDIRGEDVATVVLGQSGVTTVVTMAYAGNVHDPDDFPQTWVVVEGRDGSLGLGHDRQLKVVNRSGVRIEDLNGPSAAWVDPVYACVQESVPLCQANLLQSIRSGTGTETTAVDNLESIRLVYMAYESAAQNRVVHRSDFR